MRNEMATGGNEDPAGTDSLAAVETTDASASGPEAERGAAMQAAERDIARGSSETPQSDTGIRLVTGADVRDTLTRVRAGERLEAILADTGLSFGEWALIEQEDYDSAQRAKENPLPGNPDWSDRDQTALRSTGTYKTPDGQYRSRIDDRAEMAERINAARQAPPADDDWPDMDDN